MSEQDTTSTQSLPVDDAKPNATQRQTGGDNAADDVAQGNGFGATSDPASVDNASDAGASNASHPISNIAADAAKNTGKILGMSKHVFAALVAVVAVGAAVGVGVVLTQQPALEDWYDSNAAQGQFEGKSKEEIQAALNEEVAKGMMNISIAASITFADGSSEGEARIENIAANHFDQFQPTLPMRGVTAILCANLLLRSTYSVIRQTRYTQQARQASLCHTIWCEPHVCHMRASCSHHGPTTPRTLQLRTLVSHLHAQSSSHICFQDCRIANYLSPDRSARRARS